jgi:hypothetical protein
METSKRRLILFVPLTIVLLSWSYWLFSRHPSVASHYHREQRILKSWRQQEFTGISRDPDFRIAVREIPLSANFAPNPATVDKLYDAVYNLFLAYHEGEYHAYRAFRTPAPASFNRKVLDFERAQLADQLYPGRQLPDDAEDVFELIFTHWNNGRGITNLWHGVAFGTCSLTLERSLTLPATNLWLWAQLQENVGVFAPGAHFEFQRTPQDVLESTGELIHATLGVVMERAQPDPPFRSWIRFFWDDASGEWIPWEYVDSLAGRKDRYVIW